MCVGLLIAGILLAGCTQSAPSESQPQTADPDPDGRRARGSEPDAEGNLEPRLLSSQSLTVAGPTQLDVAFEVPPGTVRLSYVLSATVPASVLRGMAIEVSGGERHESDTLRGGYGGPHSFSGDFCEAPPVGERSGTLEFEGIVFQGTCDIVAWVAVAEDAVAQDPRFDDQA